MSHTRLLPLSAAALCVIGSSADAQFAVQQPVVGFTGVNTTVSVPDSGGAYLGGLGHSAYGERLVGPFRPGFVAGATHAHSGMSAHVWIHDPAEMDHRLLRGAQPPAPPLADRHAENVWQQLVRRAAEREQRPAVIARPERPVAAKRRADADRLAQETARSEAARQYQLGVQAQERGRGGLARLHYRAAERLGSIAARERLAALHSPQALAPSVAGFDREGEAPAEPPMR